MELTPNLKHFTSAGTTGRPSADDVYARLVSETYQFGESRLDRTGTGTKSLFGGSATFNCVNTVPLITRKKVAVRSCIAELVWFLIGSEDASLLQKLKSPIWNEWALANDQYIGRRLSINEMIVYAAAKLNTTDEKIQRLCHAEDQKHPYGYPAGTMEFMKRNKIDEFDNQLVHRAGYIGPMYGSEWNRVPKGFMQSKLEILINGLRNRPYARDHILVAWNDDNRPIYDDPRFGTTNDEIIENNLKTSRQPIPPCHFAVQFYTHMGVNNAPESLSLQFHMRSADLFLGVPFNILSYGVLLHLVARHLGLKANTVSVTFGDRHIYSNHFDQVNELLSREASSYDPTFELSNLVPDIMDIRLMSHSDVDKLNEVIDSIAACVSNYTPGDFIAAPVAK